MQDEIEKRIQNARKVATAYRKMDKISVVRSDGTVKLNTGILVQNLPEEVAVEIENSVKHFVVSLQMFLKGKSMDMFENVFPNPSTTPDDMVVISEQQESEE